MTKVYDLLSNDLYPTEPAKMSQIIGLSVKDIENINVSINPKYLRPYIKALGKVDFNIDGMAMTKNRIVLVKPLRGRKLYGLICHEACHIRQMRELGFFKFFIKYMKEYALNIKKYKTLKQAYVNISFEKEAYYNQGRYLRICYVPPERS